MVRKCSEKGCNGELTLVGGEWFCKKCGIVSEDDILEIESKNIDPLRKKVVKELSRYVYTKKTYFGEDKGTKEKIKLDIVNEDFKIPRKIKEAINYITKLDGLVKNILPLELGNKIFQKLTERTRICYILGEYPNRKKKMVIWAFFIDLVSKELGRLKPSISLENFRKEDIGEIENYVQVLNRLEEIDSNTYAEAEKFRDQLNEEENKFRINVLHKEVVYKNLKEIDCTYDQIFRDDFYKLLSKKAVEKDYFIELLELPIIMASLSLAESFVQHIILPKKYKDGKDINEIKKTGLVCVLGYIFCELRKIRVRPAKEWAEFFGISPRTFKYLYKELEPRVKIARDFLEKCKT